MATRFLAYRPCPDREPLLSSQFVATRTFQIVHESPELVVWADRPDAVYRLPNGRGVVLGWVFSDREPLSPVSLAPSCCTPVGLLDRIWGGYVAFVIDPDRRETHVLRDPSGIMPCLRIRAPAGEWLVSDMTTAQAAGLVHGGIDWTGLAWHLQAASLPLAPTALAGVSELLPGFATNLNEPPGTAMPIWSPWSHVRAPIRQSYQEAAESLRLTIDACVTSWAGAFDHILLDLSGGLDSSILAAALAHCGASCDALTYAPDGGVDDERAYARLVAEYCDTPLSEVLLALDDVDMLRPTFPDLPAPIGRCIGQAMDAPRARLAARTGADGFFNGVGGDNVFCYLRSAAPVADRIRSEGLGLGAWRSVHDVCALTSASVATVLRLARKQLRKASRASSWQPYMALLDPACRAPIEAFRHPWLESPANALPGKTAHIRSLLRISTHFHAFALDDGASLISPLRSQPLVELCLSIPSWFWSQGGRDRAVARDGFAGRLPSAIVARRSKAGPEPFCFQLLARDRSLIQERLLDGHLAREGILDRSMVEAQFKTNAPFKADVYLRLLELADAEAWIDHWSNRRAMSEAPPPR
jgi:asparagine synthase (glutamine-hydrolysing)